MRGKHIQKGNNKLLKTICFIILVILILVMIFIVYKYFYTKQEKNTNIDMIKVNEQVTVEKDKLVLKSNYEDHREKKIIYSFKENVLNKVTVIEKYNDINIYENQKKIYNKKTDIVVIEVNDKNLEIYYEKINLKTDEGLSYEEIYKKYMGIVGAYTVID